MRLIRSAVCVLAALLAAQTAAWAQDRVVAANYPPLMVGDDAASPGFAVEVLSEAARRAGRDVNLTFLPFERAIYAVQNEPATLMPALFQGKSRDDLFRWVVEIERAPLRFASVGTPVATLEAARDLQSIVVEAGTTSDALLTQLGFTNLVRVQSPGQSAQMLAAKRAEAWLLTEMLMQWTWDALDLTGPLVFGDVVHEVPIFLVASPSTPEETVAAYRDAVEEMAADGTLARLLARYMKPKS